MLFFQFAKKIFPILSPVIPAEGTPVMRINFSKDFLLFGGENSIFAFQNEKKCDQYLYLLRRGSK